MPLSFFLPPFSFPPSRCFLETGFVREAVGPFFSFSFFLPPRLPAVKKERSERLFFFPFSSSTPQPFRRDAVRPALFLPPPPFFLPCAGCARESPKSDFFAAKAQLKHERSRDLFFFLLFLFSLFSHLSFFVKCPDHAKDSRVRMGGCLTVLLRAEFVRDRPFFSFLLSPSAAVEEKRVNEGCSFFFFFFFIFFAAFAVMANRRNDANALPFFSLFPPLLPYVILRHRAKA